MLGQTLGNFRVLEMMSEGGMGQVYLARHTTLDRRAVVKVLRSHLADNEDMVRRFLNEANATAAIGHPGIVYVMDVGRLESGSPYILMEYLEGRTLARRLRHDGTPAIEVAISLVRQTADALAAAHDKGIVHRDLKPGNIFLVPDTAVVGNERVKLLDFGIAKLLGRDDGGVVTHSNVLMGTPRYMSPEQCDGARSVDHRADLYSLGCILFELLCGRTPFADAGSGGLIVAHLMQEPPSPRDLEPSVPPALEAIVLRLLAKDPEARFPGARDLIAALDEAEETLGLPPRYAAPTSVVLPAPAAVEATIQIGSGESVRPALPAGRHRRLWPMLLGMAMAAALAIAVLPRLGGDPGPPAPGPPARPALAAPPGAPGAPEVVPEVVPEELPDPAPARGGAPGETAPEERAVAISSEPGDAAVYHEGAEVGRTPYQGVYPASGDALVFVVKKPGYEERTVEVPAGGDQPQRVVLTRKQERPRPAAKAGKPGKPGAGSARSARPRSARDTLRPEEGGPVNPFE